MNGPHAGRFPDFERQITDAMKEVALELRSVDVIDLASYIHTLKLANVGDLINSALELYFKPRTLVFSYSGDVELTWFGSPSVGLDMELHCAGVDVYFRLVIEALSVGVHINYLSLDGTACDGQCDALRFTRAIDAARFPILPNSQNFWKPGLDTATLPSRG
jgi:hypothetical protein